MVSRDKDDTPDPIRPQGDTPSPVDYFDDEANRNVTEPINRNTRSDETKAGDPTDVILVGALGVAAYGYVSTETTLLNNIEHVALAAVIGLALLASAAGAWLLHTRT